MDNKICSHCNQTKASFKCNDCEKIYHLNCALKNDCDSDRAGFRCHEHLKINSIEKYMKWTHWPQDAVAGNVAFLRENDWSEIKKEDLALIRANRDKWTNYKPFWWKKDPECNLKAREILVGHYAFSTELSAINKYTQQYEAVAITTIPKDGWIGEYTGIVRYSSDKRTTGSQYVADFLHPPSLPPEISPLCIDAATAGNTTRFINSITAKHPELKQNSTMSTLWIRGSLRIVFVATRRIEKGEPIVTDYEEYDASYFQDEGNEPRRHSDYILNEFLSRNLLNIDLVSHYEDSG